MGLTPIDMFRSHLAGRDTTGVKGDIHRELNDMGTVSSVKVHCLRKLQSNKRKVAVMSPYSKRL